MEGKPKGSTPMGKLPAILLAVMALWLALNVIQDGPKQALGGVFDLFSQPQYGEADRPTRSGAAADRILDEALD